MTPQTILDSLGFRYMDLIPGTKNPAPTGWTAPDFPGGPFGDGKDKGLIIPAGVQVIDIDRKMIDGLSHFGDICNTLGVTVPRDQLKQHTGSGGLHLFFKATGETDGNPHEDIGIDGRCKGNFLKAWKLEGSTVPDLPAGLIDAIKNRARQFKGLKAFLGGRLKEIEKLTDGGRNPFHKTVNLFARLSASCSIMEDNAKAALLDAIMASGAKSEGENRDIIRSSWANGAGKPIEWKDRDIVEVEIVSMESERTADIPPRTWFIDEMMTSGFNLLCSKKGIGKSFFILQAAIGIAGGNDFLGRATTKTGVLYVPSELDRIAIHERIEKLPPLPKNLFIAYEWPRGDRALEEAEAVLEKGEIRVIVFDMFLPLLPDAHVVNDYESSAVFLRWRKLAQKYNSAVVALWHSGKAERLDFIDAAIGTTGLVGQADSVIMLERKRGDTTGKLFIGGNHGREQVIKVAFSEGKWHSIEGGDREDFLSTGDSQVLKEAKGHPEGVTAAVIGVALERSADAARQALLRLEKRGFVVKGGRGVWRAPEM